MILRSKTSNKEVRTYAALDTFSTASYMDQQLLNDLHVDGVKKLLEITTIDSTNIKINTVVAQNLKIISINKSTTLPLSIVHAKEKWPFDKGDSPTYDDIKNCKEFEKLPFHFINCKIGILIGMNEPIS